MSDGSMWTSITGWVDDYIADPIAEVFDYEDFIDLDGTEYSAGQQLMDDSWGFIKKGVNSYNNIRRAKDASGKQVRQQPFQRTQRVSGARSLGQMNLASGRGGQNYQATPISSNMVGANNALVQAAAEYFKNSNSYNSQMNNLWASYLVSPTIAQGRASKVGSPTLNRTAKTRTV
jgi:hypothetical protein